MRRIIATIVMVTMQYVATYAAEAMDNPLELADKILESLAISDPDAADQVLEDLSILNETVLDWCERHGGEFILPHIAAPGCLVDTSFWAGYLGLVNHDAAWWWQKRVDAGPHNFGLLWLVLSCDEARAALDNPARIPLQLIGPRADECPQ
ncbi:MAG: hypothetical protein OXE84_02080 [Rhodobacteraceae bacterium]|nr:hypothetical protein [Paracoccaceae bacterium]MCY4197984.1 hypothetical protein [Paracoccaceae bacterium]MCY4327005.1 hypothetical protein [Paracoccaceae bacterium]